ncbi:MAG TPA: nucleotidyltransferase domain-containing protein [Acidobacteriota bacterium]|nr:nucleotidyltransferase domain-containing protein [Acidobacteriota bacterium]
MDYTINKKRNENTDTYNKTEIDLAYSFAREAYKEFQPIVKGIILFGSSARKQNTAQSDIDVLIVIDDVGTELSAELMETYKIITHKIIQKISTRIHVTTLKFTTFFEHCRNADPIGVNVLRDGVALVDTGFFDPMQMLLKQGRIRPTMESVWTYMHRAPITLENSRWHLMRACEDLYWAVTDSAHAALMAQGVVPPSPEHIAHLLEEVLVKAKKLDRRHIKTMQFFYDLYKGITRRTIKDITGEQYEQYYRHARDFVGIMQKIVDE